MVIFVTHTGSALQAYNELCKRCGYSPDLISDSKTVEAWLPELRRIDGHRKVTPILSNSSASRLFHRLGVLTKGNKVDWKKVKQFLKIAEAIRES